MRLKVSLALWLVSTPLLADEITFKSGQTLVNVMIVSIDQAQVTVKFENGQFATYQKPLIKGLKQKPVVWTHPTAGTTAKENQKAIGETPGAARKDEAANTKPQTEVTAIPDSWRFCPGLWGDVCRSAVLPGWGQYHLGMTKTGLAFGTLFVVGMTGGLSASATAGAARRSYKNTTFRDFSILFLLGRRDIVSTSYAFYTANNHYNAYRLRVNRASGSFQAAGAVYLVQLVHAYFMGRREEALRSNQTTASGSLFVTTEPDTLRGGQRLDAGVSYGF